VLALAKTDRYSRERLLSRKYNELLRKAAACWEAHNMDFQKGDVVTLRSGGPEMTVRKVGKASFGERTISCVWFAKGKKADAAFDIEVLKRASTSSRVTSHR